MRSFLCQACSTCDSSFPTRKLHDLHHKAHNGRYQCKNCPTVTCTRVSAEKHYTTCRLTNIKCEFCNFRTLKSRTLIKHINKLHPEFKPHACTHCDKRFQHREKLTVHIRRHTGERVRSVCCQWIFLNDLFRLQPYKCLLCNLFFIDGYRLSQHVKTRYHKRVLEQSEECGFEEYLDYENL
jgi:KRAB domain-containing zinc finger protein